MTSTAFVSRTRATLRSAEFGFFGVCVYTRMHTPRFSGQPINAGDFVLARMFSRPMRTSCENVGTVLPQQTWPSSRQLSARLRNGPFRLQPVNDQFLGWPRSGRKTRTTFFALSAPRHTQARKRVKFRKGLRANPEEPARSSAPLQKVGLHFWSRLEWLTRLCGAGAPFRPLFRSIPSCLVPEPKIFPSNYRVPYPLTSREV